MKIKKRISQLIIAIKYVFYLVIANFIDDKDEKYKNLWIISERGDDARDNSFIMFKYIKENHPEINIKYIIDKKSSDYAKVRNIGDTIQYRSKEHYISMIKAKMLISTHIKGYTPQINLFVFLDKFRIFKQKGKKVFLQHGIIKDKMTYIKSDIDLFISGAKAEYDFLVNEYPQYKNSIKLTGLARYDYLKPKKDKQILIMPTWRLYLENVKDITQTDYYRRYMNLINNEKLEEILKKNDYKVIFYPHYEMQKYIRDFKSKYNNVIIADFEHFDVQELLNNSDILITDFSSVFFDFAYMKKTIIYYQFDEQKYREGHYAEGYFNYRKDGFGIVTDDEKCVIAEIQKTLQEKCIMRRNYKEKVDSFFELEEGSSCKRIFNELEKLNNE